MTAAGSPTRERTARRLSSALAVTLAITAATSLFFWQPFHRDVPAGVGNLRGTALALLILALPTLLVGMALARRGSPRGKLLWAAALAYIAYNAVMFCFAAHFNAYFLLFTTLLGLAFWSLVTLMGDLDLVGIEVACAGVPARPVAVYLLVSTAFFALAWLAEIVPAVLSGEMPSVITQAGLTQNTVWVLDFAFTFPLMVVGAILLWRRRAWGYLIAGTMVVMLTLETAGVAIDQAFGHLHDPAAPLAAVPLMIGFTALGLVCSAFYLRGIASRIRT